MLPPAGRFVDFPNMKISVPDARTPKAMCRAHTSGYRSDRGGSRRMRIDVGHEIGIYGRRSGRWTERPASPPAKVLRSIDGACMAQLGNVALRHGSS
jgi:hypothetical protein